MIGRIALYSIFLSCAFTLLIVVTLLRFVEFESVVAPASLVTVPQALTAEAWGIFDLQTGVVKAGKNTDAALPIASITKLFTAVAVMESQKRDDAFSILPSDIDTEGRSGKLSAGDTFTLYELVFPLLLESSNDAATAISRYLDSDFIALINQGVRDFALNQTVIIESTGLTENNVSSVFDLAHFYSYLRKKYPHIIDITQLRRYVGPHNGYVNNNPARTLENYTGGKHGYTEHAGHTFLGSFRFLGSNEEIGVVIIGSSNIMRDIESLLAYSRSLEMNSGIMK